ncbi:glycoside hydrolase family 25 [Pyrrhoderma noxium]|uniref:N,O-diacetylmuramidase n=1 Tax=Pyrrhoderma noxium TaxID=2282107 RepID=A0A286UWW0_9AGAM|nr:glycoside hydrolase family 25 [Pyrrhoderma noxium]
MSFRSFIHLLLLAVALSLAQATHALPSLLRRATLKGIDVSDFTTGVNFNSVRANGVSFVYIKATEGTTFISDLFSSQYTGATNAGLIRGAYHFAHPDRSSGATQANFFLAHGGGWSSDGITLPGTIDLENNPSGAECYGLTVQEMVSWIKDFSDTYHTKTGRFPVIYTTTSWWETCTGNSAAFADDNPLWIAHFSSAVGPLPAGWSFYTFWQNADSASPNPGDSDLFNGDSSQLARFAKGS